MRLDSLEPNAYYDLTHGRPQTFEKDGDGTWLYRNNIAAHINEETGQQDMWQCREIRLAVKPTKALCKKTIIRSVVDECAEFALVNGYNKHVTGVKTDQAAVDAYKEFLQFTEDVDVLLDEDFNDYVEEDSDSSADTDTVTD